MNKKKIYTDCILLVHSNMILQELRKVYVHHKGCMLSIVYQTLLS